MTKTQIVELADTRTERRGKTLNKKLELLNALQEFCMESRFYWRKKTVTFSTIAGTATYDLSASGGINESDAEEIIDLQYIKTSTNVVTLTKIFDSVAQQEIAQDVTTGEPGSFFIEAGTAQTVRISPIPAGVYTMNLIFWAVPNFDPDDSSEVVPLVPAWLHRTVAKLLERNILGFLFGESDGRFMRADAEYQKQLQQAMAKRDGVVGKITEWKSHSHAVRSTR
jgi:hypothetical protein